MIYRNIKGNILDQPLIEDIMCTESIDRIVHFAAESHVDCSITDPDAFLETNIMGTHILLKVAKKFWLDESSVVPHRFHHVSTDEVYGSLAADALAFPETTPYVQVRLILQAKQRPIIWLVPITIPMVWK